MDDELAYWLALSRCPWPGREAMDALLAGRIGPRALLEGTAGACRIDWGGVERDLHWLQRPDHHVLWLAGPHYPECLREIPDPPLVLFVRGRTQALCQPQVAIVGSRRASPGGRDTAFALARDLARAGLAITSGLARGIDAAGHRGALAGGGMTLAVAGNGLDRVYPPQHAELAERIAARGAVLSEFAPGTPPLAGNFPRRNRIISGLSLGVLVVEAARRSGSLITARHAAEQGRDVFAVPGSVHNPLAQGCHRLIRDGAKLVEAASDVLEELPSCTAAHPTARCDERAPGKGCVEPVDHARVLRAVGYEWTPFDSIVQRSGLTPESVSSILLALELGGAVVSIPGGAYIRAARR